MGFWKNLTETIFAPSVYTSINAAAAPAVKGIVPDASALAAGKTPDELTCPRATRVTVVGRDGRVFEDYDLFDNGCTVVVQDDGRTVKVLRR